MAYDYRPDLLPLAVPTRIGLPYHGLVTNGRLALPGIGTLAYPAMQNGSAWQVANPVAANTRARTPEEIADDTANGYAWKTWALVNDYGTEKRVGQYPLAEKRWLYMDPAGTVWQLEVGSAVAGDTITITVAVRGRWGVFTNIPDPVVNRQIGSAAHQITLPAWWSNDFNGNRSLSSADIAAGFTSYGFALRDLDFSEDGSHATWNLRSDRLVPVGISYFPDCTVPGNLLGWADILISGTGSLQPGTFGAGLSATIATKGLADVWEEWECLPYGLDPSDPSNFSSQQVTYDLTSAPGPSGSCSGGDETQTTWTYTPRVYGTGVAKKYYVWNWVGRTYVYANGTVAKAFFSLEWDYSDQTTVSGDAKLLVNWDCWKAADVWSWRIITTSCLSDTALSHRATRFNETYNYGVAVGANVVACQYRTVFESSQSSSVIGLPGCSTPAGSTSSTSYHQLIGPNGTQTTYQVDDIYGATWQMQIASRSNTCWGVRFSNVWTLRPSFLQAGVASRHLVTAGSSTTLTGDPYTLAFSATLHPVTGAVVWSDTDSVCWV